MHQTEYLTTVTTRNFLYQQSKIVAFLLKENKTKKQITAQIIEQNLFQQQSKERTVGYVNEIIKRLSFLNEELLQAFLDTDPATSKAILYYALLKKDRLLYEWSRELVWEKRRVLEYVLQRRETEHFIDKKREQNKKVASWRQNTQQKVTTALHQVLIEAGYATKVKQDLLLEVPYVDPIVTSQLKKSEQDRAVEIVLGEVLYETSS